MILKGGKVLHNDLINDPFYLKEDLLQVEYSNELLSSVIIDLGWYENESKDGNFKIFIIQHNDWDNPIFVIEFKTVSDLKYQLDRAIDLGLSLIKNK